MKTIQNKLLPPRGYSAIMLFGFLFTRDKSKVTATTVRHESIHVRQMWELLIVGFYVWYFVEWVVRLCAGSNDAYRAISFEREAYSNQGFPDYLENRKFFTFLKYIKNDNR
jgi:hypothetical protein